MSQPLSQLLELQNYKAPKIRANYANLKRKSIADLEKILKSPHASKTLKGLVYLILQNKPKNCVCVCVQ